MQVARHTSFNGPREYERLLVEGALVVLAFCPQDIGRSLLRRFKIRKKTPDRHVRPQKEYSQPGKYQMMSFDTHPSPSKNTNVTVKEETSQIASPLWSEFVVQRHLCSDGFTASGYIGKQKNLTLTCYAADNERVMWLLVSKNSQKNTEDGTKSQACSRMQDLEVGDTSVALVKIDRATNPAIPEVTFVGVDWAEKKLNSIILLATKIVRKKRAVLVNENLIFGGVDAGTQEETTEAGQGEGRNQGASTDGPINILVVVLLLVLKRVPLVVASEKDDVLAIAYSYSMTLKTAIENGLKRKHLYRIQPTDKPFLIESTRQALMSLMLEPDAILGLSPEHRVKIRNPHLYFRRVLGQMSSDPVWHLWFNKILSLDVEDHVGKNVVIDFACTRLFRKQDLCFLDDNPDNIEALAELRRKLHGRIFPVLIKNGRPIEYVD